MPNPPPAPPADRAAYEDDLVQAVSAMARGRWHQAARHVQRARRHPGCEREPEALEAWADLAMHLPRRQFRQGWQRLVLDPGEGPLAAVGLALEAGLVLAGGAARVVRAWEVGTGRPDALLADGAGAVLALAVRSDGREALAGTWEPGGGGRIQVWDPREGRLHSRLSGGEGRVTSVRLDRSGTQVLAGGGDARARWLELPTGRCLGVLTGHGDAVTDARFSLDGRLALTTSWDGTACLWELAEARPVRTLGDGEGLILAGDLTPDGLHAVLAREDGSVEEWDVETERRLRRLTAHQGPVTGVEVSPEGHHLFTAGADGRVRVWDMRSGDQLGELAGHQGRVRAVRLAADARMAASVGDDGTVRLWTLDWELGQPPAGLWDEAARPWLRAFLAHHPPARGADGRPVWPAVIRRRLDHWLGCAGYGWLDPETVDRRLAELAAASPA